jgi:hypothetical protein
MRHSGWGSCIALPAVDSESMGIRRSRDGDEWSENYLSCDDSSSRSRRGDLKLGESFGPAVVEITCWSALARIPVQLNATVRIQRVATHSTRDANLRTCTAEMKFRRGKEQDIEKIRAQV